MTTRQEKLQAITKAIQEAVPDIMKLQRGCFFSGDGYDYGMIVNMHSNAPFMFCATVARGEYEVRESVDFDKSLITIHGLPIGIREILLCLNTKSKDEDDYIIMSTDGWFSIVKSDNENDNMLSVAQYNLHKDRIEDQDDELIDFLFTFTQY